MPTDKNNNVYMLEFGNTRIGMLDAKTNEAQDLDDAVPALAAAARPVRRPGPAVVRRIWRQRASRMFDPATEQIKEWKLPTPWSQPYDVAPSKGAAKCGPARC